MPSFQFIAAIYVFAGKLIFRNNKKDFFWLIFARGTTIWAAHQDLVFFKKSFAFIKSFISVIKRFKKKIKSINYSFNQMNKYWKALSNKIDFRRLHLDSLWRSSVDFEQIISNVFMQLEAERLNDSNYHFSRDSSKLGIIFA